MRWMFVYIGDITKEFAPRHLNDFGIFVDDKEIFFGVTEYKIAIGPSRILFNYTG